MTETTIEALWPPKGVYTAPVQANRFGNDENWPKRGSIIVYPRDHTVYRVAKVGSRQDSWPNAYLVPVEEVPLEGTDGRSRSHYGHRTGYLQTDVATLARNGARIVLRVTQAEEDFITAAIERQRAADEAATATRAAYHGALSGGVADRIETEIKHLRWRATEQSDEARNLDRCVADLSREAERIAAQDPVLAQQVRNAITGLIDTGVTMRRVENLLGGYAATLGALVSLLREHQDG